MAVRRHKDLKLQNMYNGDIFLQSPQTNTRKAESTRRLTWHFQQLSKKNFYAILNDKGEKENAPGWTHWPYIKETTEQQWSSSWYLTILVSQNVSLKPANLWLDFILQVDVKFCGKLEVKCE